ncbi:hypothetical protein LPJ61_001887 [Coemansia biformis]|uniref:PB1 domain-containing protein n=1 Tax=Coemansia biformis TaxID=1286918 RepID=A0A9W8CXP9_9FUNG|nr:hypothetical protein LPJ61_001887 [Coemansia biformis]
MTFVGMSPEDVRAAQRARVLAAGGRVLKFTNNGGELYFRYYFPQPEKLTWTKLVNGLRVLFSISHSDLYIRYADPDGAKITVSDNNGLQIMFEDTKASDVIRIEVIEPKSAGVNADESRTPPEGSQPSMQMPMPVFDQQSGFPGVDITRPHSVVSSRVNTGQLPQMPQSQTPGPIPHAPQQPINAGPIHSGSQIYDRMNTSTTTLPPPRPQKPLD